MQKLKSISLFIPQTWPKLVFQNTALRNKIPETHHCTFTQESASSLFKLKVHFCWIRATPLQLLGLIDRLLKFVLKICEFSSCYLENVLLQSGQVKTGPAWWPARWSNRFFSRLKVDAHSPHRNRRSNRWPWSEEKVIIKVPTLIKRVLGIGDILVRIRLRIQILWLMKPGPTSFFSDFKDAKRMSYFFLNIIFC